MVSKKYYYDIDLNGNRLLDFAVESVSGELPSEAKEGAVIYHSGEGVMYQRLKDGWKVIASGKDLEDALSKVSEDLQALSKDTEEVLKTKQDKLVAGSHISIAADGKTISSTAQVNVIETVKVNNTALEVSGKAVNIDLSDYAKKGDVTTVMRYKGSVSTVTSLPTTDVTLGDTYNVIDTNANYTWDGSAWDLIGSTVDLSGYATKAEVDSALGGKVSKGGDTLTGNYTVDGQLGIKASAYVYSGVMFPASEDGKRTRMAFRGVGGQNGDRIMMLIDNNQNYAPITILSNLTAPKITIGDNNVLPNSVTPTEKSDNSTRIATTAWVNQSDFLVHTTGNESISGTKTFYNGIIVNGAVNRVATYKAGEIPTTTQFVTLGTIKGSDNKEYGFVRAVVYPDSKRRKLQMAAYTVNDDGTTSESGVFEIYSADGSNRAYATAPNTPPNATFNEIATADWVRKKIASNDVHVGGDSTFGKWYRLATHPKVTATYYDGHMMLAVWDNYQYNDYPVTRNGILNVHIRRSNTGFNGKIRFTLAGADIQYTSYALVLYSDFSAEVYVKQTNQYGRPSATRINHNIDGNNWVIDDADTTAVDSLDGLGGTILYSQPPLIFTPENKADNTAVPVNAKWVNQSNFLVHTTGNETISGSKVFTIPVTDPQNQSGRVSTPNSNASANPYYKIASISMDNVSAWDTVTLMFDVEWGWGAREHHVCTFRAFFSTDGDKAISRALLSRIWSSGETYATVLNADHWWILHNATTKEVQIWMKDEYNQLNLNYRVRMSGRRNENFAKWTIHSGFTGLASLPSTDDGWVIVNATDTSNMMASNLQLQLADPRLDMVNTRYVRGTAPGGTCYWVAGRFLDNSSTPKPVMSIEGTVLKDERRVYQFAIISNNDVWQYPVKIVANSDNSGAYMVCPTPASKTENSTQVATTAWVNQSDFLVHTTGNETVAGIKSYTSPIVLNAWTGLHIKENAITKGSATQDRNINVFTGFYDKNDDGTNKASNWLGGLRYTVPPHTTDAPPNTFVELSNQYYRDTYLRLYDNGTTAYATCPNPPSNATGQEIATADWSLGKFVQKSGDTMTGGA